MEGVLPSNERGRGGCGRGAGGVAAARDGAVLSADGRVAIGWLDSEQVPARCPRCGSTDVCRWGRASPARGAAIGARRWRCRSCCRTYSGSTGTVLAGIRAPGKFRAVVADMLGPSPASCRHLATLLGLDKMTIWAWRMKAAAAFALGRAEGSTGPVAMACSVLRESRKASRMWVDHERDPQRYPKPDRLRWIDYRLRGLTPPDWQARYRIPVQFAVDERGCCRAEILLRTDAAPAAATSGRTVTSTTARGPDGGAAVATPGSSEQRSAQRPDRPPPHYGRSVRSRPCPLSATPDLDPLKDSFRGFLEPFRGPATIHLPAYVAWFIARLSAAPGAAIQM